MFLTIIKPDASILNSKEAPLKAQKGLFYAIIFFSLAASHLTVTVKAS
jgi:hypothetical protein